MTSHMTKKIFHHYLYKKYHFFFKIKFPAVNKVSHQDSTPTITTSTTSDRLSPVRPDERLRNRVHSMHQRSHKSMASQTSDAVLYRLRVFPTLKDIVNEEAKPPDPGVVSRLMRFFRFLGRLALSQFGKLAPLLIPFSKVTFGIYILLAVISRRYL